MADRYELKTARKGKDDKTYWTKVGIMFPMKGDKDGFNIIFEAMPLMTTNDKGEVECRVAAWPPYEDNSQRGRQKQPTSHDDIPFGDEIEGWE